ncbi:hypothetical protein [Paraburkholderia sp. HP33-1]|uniref:hypothetical protein n=1 Tax=Paraburkholderia sp. HP33-1 TaxID=2883243 RepID=UPI001F1EA0FC|nr:hypothetical protein [Paraburkholderia sp. HP33-1]
MITIFPADVNLTPDLPHVSGLDYQGVPIETYFSQSAPALQLSVDWSFRNQASSILADSGLDMAHLEQALELILPHGAGTSAGLLLCDSLIDDPVLGLDPNQYGFMFDLEGDTNTELQPRRGCAIFLSAIQARSGDLSPADMQEFIAFTAIHELGHLFNLWHSADSSSTFMTPHPDPEQIPSHALGNTFEEIHEDYLKFVNDPSESQFVLPGGSNFGDRISGFPSGTDPADSLESPADRLNLQIHVSHETCYSCEPIELFVTASVADPVHQLVTLDEFHPSYPRFEIWITNPAGERRRHRPTHLYCRPGPSIAIRQAEAIHREIWLGGSSRAPTFRAPGIYELEVWLKGGAASVATSNRVQVEVLPAEPRDRRWQEMKGLLAIPSLRNTLRYRRLTSRSAYEALSRMNEVRENSATGRAINYALGVALQKAGKSSRSNERALALQKQGILYLQQALLGETHEGRRARIDRMVRETKKGKIK